MESLANHEFDELSAYDTVMPLDHGPRMLGFIAYMLANYLGMKDEGEKPLIDICMPWLPDDLPAEHPFARKQGIGDIRLDDAGCSRCWQDLRMHRIHRRWYGRYEWVL